MNRHISTVRTIRICLIAFSGLLGVVSAAMMVEPMIYLSLGFMFGMIARSFLVDRWGR